MQYENGDEALETDALSDDEIVADSELTVNNERLSDYVARIREIAMAVQEQTAAERGAFGDLANATQRQVWLEYFTDGLYENQEFSRLSLDIMDGIGERFELVQSGNFERNFTGCPTTLVLRRKGPGCIFATSPVVHRQPQSAVWPAVDPAGQWDQGTRFFPAQIMLNCQDDDWRLVLLDGEGLGHSAREATSVSTKVTEKFPETDMILLVDNAQSAMQAAPLELMRSVGSSGHGDKLAVVFTHFDQVRGDTWAPIPRRCSTFAP